MYKLICIITFYAISLENAETKLVPNQFVKIENAITSLAVSSGFSPQKRIVMAIIHAAKTYKIDALELTAIAIIETGIGSNIIKRKNKNGTYDHGLFQINTVNHKECVEYNLDSYEGSSLCAAKILSRIKNTRKDYIGVYHSKTPRLKSAYRDKIDKILKNN